MSSSVPIPNDLKVNTVSFADNTRLVSATDFYFNTRLRKKLRVDKDVEFREDLTVYGNVNVLGNITSGQYGETPKQYVDSQTGWGMPEWTFAGATYNPETDSLIIKISNIELNYATISYVNSQFQNSSAKYLIAHAAYNYPSLTNPSVGYSFPVTTLTANSAFIIRDGQNSFNDFKFQRGSITPGYVLKCFDAEGTVQWGPENTTSYESQLIATNYGATNTQYSFKVIDAPSGRGVLIFPNLLSNLYNKAISPNATGLLLGTGNSISYQHPFVIGCYSEGTEMIEFKNSTSTTTPNGSIRITGGSSTLDQGILLNPDGMFFSPKFNKGIQFILPPVSLNLALNQWPKPVSIFMENAGSNAYPPFIVTKQSTGSTPTLTSVMINPRAAETNFSPMQLHAMPQIIFGDTTQFDADGTSTTYPTHSKTLTFAAWAYKNDGIQIKNSLASEDSVPNNMISGFCRMTGNSNVVLTGVPTHYIETNRDGIYLKNSATTKTTNYGTFQILNKNGPILNNPSNEIGIVAGLKVGDISSGFLPSEFNGNVTIQEGTLYYKKQPTVNNVLTCVDATTGRAEWLPTQVSSYPTNITTPMNFYSTVDVVGKLSFNDFNSVDIMRTENVSPDGFYSTHYQDIQTTNVYVGYTLGIYAPSLNGPNNYPNDTWLYAWTDPLIIGKLFIPANYNNRIAINIPIAIQNNWCFGGDMGASSANPDNEGVTFDYFIERIEVVLLLNGVEFVSFTYQNSSAHSSSDLGSFFVKYERASRSGGLVDLNGPGNDKTVMTQKVIVGNPTIQFTLPKVSTNKEYDISVKYYWSFKYGSYGGSENTLKNHWGTGDPSHWFLPWSVILLQSYSQTWIQYQNNYNSIPPTYGTQFGQYYKNFSWSQPQSKNTTNFTWGTYYSNLPWGQISLLNSDQIYTNKKVLCGYGQFGNLYVNGDMQSLGIMNCKGYMGRPGLGPSNDNPFAGYADIAQHNTIVTSNIFNNHWTGQKVETWVDVTLLLSQSPNVSDYRIKSNFHPISNVLNDICKTPIYQFDVDYDLYQVSSKTGIIAHELQENFSSFPNLVTGSKDAVDGNGKIIPQTVDYQELAIVLMKGIQELKYEIDLLRHEIQLLRSSSTSS